MHIKLHSRDSDTVQLSFKGDIQHPRGTHAARGITFDAKECLRNYFNSNRKVLPSNKLREELANVDEQVYVVDNLTGAGTTKTAIEELAFKARTDASYLGVLRVKDMELQNRLTSTEEREFIAAGHTIRYEFGWKCYRRRHGL